MMIKSTTLIITSFCFLIFSCTEKIPDELAYTNIYVLLTNDNYIGKRVHVSGFLSKDKHFTSAIYLLPNKDDALRGMYLRGIELNSRSMEIDFDKCVEKYVTIRARFANDDNVRILYQIDSIATNESVGEKIVSSTCYKNE